MAISPAYLRKTANFGVTMPGNRRRIAGSQCQRGLHSGATCGIELGDHIADKQNLARRDRESLGDLPIALGLLLRSRRRVVVPRKQRQQVAGDRMTKEQSLRLNAA